MLFCIYCDMIRSNCFQGEQSHAKQKHLSICACCSQLHIVLYLREIIQITRSGSDTMSFENNYKIQ